MRYLKKDGSYEIFLKRVWEVEFGRVYLAWFRREVFRVIGWYLVYRVVLLEW